MLEALLMCTLCVSFCQIAGNNFYLDVHYVCYVFFSALSGRGADVLQISIIIIYTD